MACVLTDAKRHADVSAEHLVALHGAGQRLVASIGNPTVESFLALWVT